VSTKDIGLVRQGGWKYRYTAELLAPDHTPFEVQIAIANLKIYTSLVTEKPPNDQIQFG
jgi:hypothetical protein